jgi:methionyl-tRNA synthetase
MKEYYCTKCGHEIRADEKPQPVKWKDGHVCHFEEKAKMFKSIYFSNIRNRLKQIIETLDQFEAAKDFSKQEYLYMEIMEELETVRGSMQYYFGELKP